jgi:hypothetical protein
MSVAVRGKNFIGQLKFPVIPELLDKSSNQTLVLIRLSFPPGSFRRTEILWLASSGGSAALCSNAFQHNYCKQAISPLPGTTGEIAVLRQLTTQMGYCEGRISTA